VHHPVIISPQIHPNIDTLSRPEISWQSVKELFLIQPKSFLPNIAEPSYYSMVDLICYTMELHISINRKAIPTGNEGRESE